MASYPATIPAPSLGGYGIDPVPGVMRSDAPGGLRRQRQRVANPGSRVTVRWVFTEAEFAVFEAWFAHTLNHGAAWFSTSLRNGQGASTVTARFDGVWDAAATGVAWVVSAVLRVRVLPVAA